MHQRRAYRPAAAALVGHREERRGSHEGELLACCRDKVLGPVFLSEEEGRIEATEREIKVRPKGPPCRCCQRAVRAALELVGAVETLGADIGVPTLSARAGVLSGEAAVNLAAVGEGMVAGDLVNTASRLQSAAAAGQVLVGDATYLATRDAISFEEVGELALKGKAEPVAGWRALRVVGQRRGAGKTEAIEPPFVGRDEELRLLAELLHATAREQTVRLVSVTGIAGIGKSRLAASSSFEIGTPHTAITASPMNFSTNPAVAGDDGAGDVEVGGEQLTDFFGILCLRHGGEADEVAEEDRDPPALGDGRLGGPRTWWCPSGRLGRSRPVSAGGDERRAALGAEASRRRRRRTAGITTADDRRAASFAELGSRRVLGSAS